MAISLQHSSSDWPIRPPVSLRFRPIIGLLSILLRVKRDDMTLTPAATYDVAIIGGAMSGAATANVLLRRNPALRVLIVERSAAFERRVGESTIEISTFFLMRVLGLSDHLNEHHYVKQGLRFCYANAEAKNFDDCAEIGGRFLSRVPAFMVDRAVLDAQRRIGALRLRLVATADRPCGDFPGAEGAPRPARRAAPSPLAAWPRARGCSRPPWPPCCAC